MSTRVSKTVGKWWCAIIRWRGGKHQFESGRCVRCHRKQPVRKAKAAI